MNQDNDSDAVLSKFFKVYLSDETRDDLELPISFNRFLPKTLSKTVNVRSIYGKTWRLVLKKCEGDVEKYVMVNGWKRIVKDEDLKDGDFLAFEFDGYRYFNFCIYEGLTMCKRLRRSSVQSKETKVESDGEEKTQSSDDVGDDYTDDDDNSDETEAVEDDDDEKYLDDPANPCFTMTLNPNRKSQLEYINLFDDVYFTMQKIPAHVIKDYGLHFPERITVIDPLVHKYGTMEKNVKIQMNGCIFVKKFGCVIRRNKMKTSDKMICEVKKTGTNVVHTIKVSIIRG